MTAPETTDAVAAELEGGDGLIDANCVRCGRLYLAEPDDRWGLCGMHTVYFDVEIGDDEPGARP